MLIHLQKANLSLRKSKKLIILTKSFQTSKQSTKNKAKTPAWLDKKELPQQYLKVIFLQIAQRNQLVKKSIKHLSRHSRSLSKINDYELVILHSKSDTTVSFFLQFLLE